MRKAKKATVAVLITTTLAAVSACHNGTPTTLMHAASHERRDGHGHGHSHGHTPPNNDHLGHLRRISMTWPSNGPGDEAAGQYQQMIVALRQTGHQYHGIYITQPRSSDGLIHLQINMANRGSVVLWFTANNLYLRGFENNDGRIYYFSDYEMPDAMRAMGIQPAVQLGFNGGYGALERRAGRSRQEAQEHPGLQLSFSTLEEAVRGLADTRWRPGEPDRDIARRLLIMIQFTSESARFAAVNGRMRDAMRTNAPIRVTDREVELENSWDPISQFARELIERPHNTRPTEIRGVGELRNWRDVRRIVRLLLSYNPRQGSHPPA